MDEFGETPTFYLWPKHHEEGEPIDNAWYEKLYAVLQAADIDWEAV